MISLRLNIYIFYGFSILTKRSFFYASRASIKQLKLAFIPQYCHLNLGFKGTNRPHIEILIHSSSSQIGGEKPSNRFSLGLTPAVKAAFVGATIMLSAIPANAQDNTVNPSIQPVAVSVDGASPAAIKDVIVPIRDSRGINLSTIQVSAGAASNEGIVVVFYGSDRQAFAEMKEAMRRAIADGKPVRGMMMSDAKERGSIEIWADTQFFGGEIAPFDNLSNKMDNTLADAADYVSEMQAKRQKQASNASETTLTALNP